MRKLDGKETCLVLSKEKKYLCYWLPQLHYGYFPDTLGFKELFPQSLYSVGAKKLRYGIDRDREGMLLRRLPTHCRRIGHITSLIDLRS